MPDLTGSWGWVGAASSPSQTGCKFGGKAVRLLGDGRCGRGLNRVGGVVLMVCIINSRVKREGRVNFRSRGQRMVPARRQAGGRHRKHRRQQDGGKSGSGRSELLCRNHWILPSP